MTGIYSVLYTRSEKSLIASTLSTISSIDRALNESLAAKDVLGDLATAETKVPIRKHFTRQALRTLRSSNVICRIVCNGYSCYSNLPLERFG